jgi:hypothetical protein
MIGNLRYVYERVKYIVEYLLKAKTVEPETKPLLYNDCERATISDPFLGNGSQNIIPRKRILQQLSCNNRAGVLYCGPFRGHIRGTRFRA